MLNFHGLSVTVNLSVNYDSRLLLWIIQVMARSNTRLRVLVLACLHTLSNTSASTIATLNIHVCSAFTVYLLFTAPNLRIIAKCQP